MFKLIYILIAILSYNLFSEVEISNNDNKIITELDEIISKIYSPDLNVISAYREKINFLNSIILLSQNELKAEVVLSYTHAKICFNTFLTNEIFSDYKYGALNNYYLLKMKLVDRKIAYIESSDEYIDNFKIFLKLKEKNCQFKVIDTDIKEKLEKRNSRVLYLDILNLKEKTHPFFVQFINNLFGLRSKITNLSKENGNKFEKGDFENNFIQYYFSESEKLNSKSKKNIFDLEELLNIKAEVVYTKYCKGMTRYESIPFKSLRELLCIDDNLSQLTKNCNQFYCFKVLDQSSDAIELSPKVPLFIVSESKEEKCIDDFLLSAKYKKTLIDQIISFPTEKFHNEKKCPIDVNYISSQSTFRVFKKIIGFPRVSLMSSELFNLQYIVKDQRGYFFEISDSTFQRIKNNQIFDNRKKLLHQIEKNGIWEKNLNEMYQICSSKKDLDYYKSKYDLQLTQLVKSRMKTDSAECFYYSFKDVESFKKAIIFLDVRL